MFCRLRREAEKVKYQVLSDLDILCKSLQKNNAQGFIRKHCEDALKDLSHQVSLTQCIVMSVTDHDITRIMYKLKAETLIFTDTGQVRLFEHIQTDKVSCVVSSNVSQFRMSIVSNVRRIDIRGFLKMIIVIQSSLQIRHSQREDCYVNCYLIVMVSNF